MNQVLNRFVKFICTSLITLNNLLFYFQMIQVETPTNVMRAMDIGVSSAIQSWMALIGEV